MRCAARSSTVDRVRRNVRRSLVGAALFFACAPPTSGTFDGVLVVKVFAPGAAPDSVPANELRRPARFRLEARPDREIVLLGNDGLGCAFRAFHGDVSGPPWSRSMFASLRFLTCDVDVPGAGHLSLEQHENPGTMYLSRRAAMVDGSTWAYPAGARAASLVSVHFDGRRL